MTWERTAAAASHAPPERVWAVLLDGRSWSLWKPGVQWMTLEGPLAAGSLLTMKPKGAPQTAFRVETVIPERRLDLVVTFGPVATLRLGWEIAPGAGGAGSTIAQTIAISGPLAGLLLRRAAARIADAAPDDLARLAARAAEQTA